MSTSFRGRVSQIAGDLVQVWDTKTGHSAFLRREQIAGGGELRLNDEILVEGEEARRHARRLSGAPVPAATSQAAAG